MIYLPRIIWILPFIVTLSASALAADDRTIPIIDAHSQMDHEISIEEIIRLMDEAGVARTILSPRRNVKPERFLAGVSRCPDRIIPAVRTKGNHYIEGRPDAFKKYLDNQARNSRYGAMGEVLIWHAEKYHHTQNKPIAPQVVFPPDSPKVGIALKTAARKGWPFIAHIEFAAIGPDREKFMSGFEALLNAHRDHPFVLIHMGELEAEDVRRLIESHGNIHFITAMCNPVALKNTREPLVNLFEQDVLAPRWKDLFIAYSDRFILGFDNVWARHWRKIYIPQVLLWRKALGGLPEDVAHQIAHGNAERLWNLMEKTGRK